jgi:4'-phosphopantetheinyl transferase
VTAGHWAAASCPSSLAIGGIDLWLARLDEPAGDAAALLGVLSADERARAQRFVYDRDRKQFVTTRAVLRHLLGGYLERDPAAIEFGYNRHGKPRLLGQASPLEFNVSHSSDAAVFAFSRAGAVGVDVEAIREVADGDNLAERFFAPAEAQALRAVPPVLRDRAFFNCWTRKEAFIKAVGDGCGYALDSFEVTLAPSDPVRVVHVGGDRHEARQWTLTALPADPGYVGALAVRGEPRAIRYLAWSATLPFPQRDDVARSRCISL